MDFPPPPGFPLPLTFGFNRVAVAEGGTIYAGGQATNVIDQFDASG